jgi:hypothetical protein
MLCAPPAETGEVGGILRVGERLLIPLVRLLNLLGQGELEEPNKYRNLADNWQQIKSRRR